MTNQNQHFNNVIIASGPVIIRENKVLLSKRDENKPWMFPGGDITQPVGDLEFWAAKKAKEEMGLEIKIVKPIKPMVLWLEDQVVVLVHYLAELLNDEFELSQETKQYIWMDIDNLAEDCAPNVKPVIEEYKKLKN